MSSSDRHTRIAFTMMTSIIILTSTDRAMSSDLNLLLDDAHDDAEGQQTHGSRFRREMTALVTVPEPSGLILGISGPS